MFVSNSFKMRFSLMASAVAVLFCETSGFTSGRQPWLPKPSRLSMSTEQEAYGTIDSTPPLKATLFNSQLMYSFSDLRKIVKNHEETFQEGDLSEEEKTKKGIVAFKHPELVDSRFSPTNEYKTTKLRKPVTCNGIVQFLEENKGYFSQGEFEDISFVPTGDSTGDIFMEKKLKALGARFDTDIVEYDDTTNPNMKLKVRGTELVYAVMINKTEKRVIVVFRGSVVLKDWIVDLNFKKSNPDLVKEMTDADLKLHAGFASYLLEEKGDNDKTKFEEIVEILKEIYSKEEFKDYLMVVTGHSLGGALTQLLGFMLAGSPRTEFLPKPVLAVSYASPVVGNDGFRLVSQEYERAHKLRHIRVSNDNDVVPGYPPPIITGDAFTQTGVNLHVRKKGRRAEVGYRQSKSIVRLFSLDSIQCHSLEGELSYNRRLFCLKEGEQVNDKVLSMTVKELYDCYAGDCTK